MSEPRPADDLAALCAAAAAGGEGSVAATERLLWLHHARLMGLANRKIGWFFGWVTFCYLFTGLLAIDSAMSSTCLMPLFNMAPNEGTARTITAVVMVIQAMLAIASTRIMAVVNSAAVGIELTISDTGPGLKVSELERIFEPFHTSKAAGLGMGLAISRSIIDAHGGRIWVTCNPDRGITAHVELPSEPGLRRNCEPVDLEGSSGTTTCCARLAVDQQTDAKTKRNPAPDRRTIRGTLAEFA